MPNQIEAPVEIDTDDSDDSLEEAYTRIRTGTMDDTYTIEVPNAFADNVKHYLAIEGVDNTAIVNGNKTYIDISTKADVDSIEESIKKNVMGDMTYLKVYKSSKIT